jgi:sortase A
MQALSRPLAIVLALVGAGTIAWVGVTLAWGEPFTAVSAARSQAALRSELERKEEPGQRAGGRSATSGRVASARDRMREGDAIGRLVVPRLDVRMVVVEGTRSADLSRGPGHYRNTSLPGSGAVVAIAGHRTTYGHPFLHIDDLEPGDRISLQMPYGTYLYVVYAHRVVDDQDWSILRPRSFEKLVLTACHPLYSAAQRYVVFARLRSGPVSQPLS